MLRATATMRPGGAALRAAATLCCLLLLLVGDGLAVEQRHYEHGGGYTNGLPRDSTIIVGSVGAGVAVCLLVLAGYMAFRGSVRLSVTLGLAVCVAVIAVGISSWAVTYVRCQDTIVATTELVLRRAAMEAKLRVETDLGSGVNLLLVIRDAVAMDLANFDNVYPSDQLQLLWPYHNLLTESLMFLFYGAPGNGNVSSIHGPSIIGVSRAETPEGHPHPDSQVYSVSHIFPHNSTDIPDFLDCPALDRNNNMTSPTSCAEYVCGTHADGDFVCQRTCADREVAELLRANTARGVPRMYPDAAPEYCTHAEGQPMLSVIFNTRYEPTRGGLLAPAPDALSGEVRTPYLMKQRFPFNPLVRPWWTNATEPLFSPPYVFVLEDSVGFTASIGAYDEAGMFKGCVGVDFNLASTERLLRNPAFLPTQSTSMFLTDLEGHVLGSSMSLAALEADTGLSTRSVIHVHQVRNPASILARTVNTIEGRHGSLLKAHSDPFTAIYTDNFVTIAVPVAEPRAQVRYLLLLSLPLADVLGEAVYASTLSLVITIVVSVVVGALLSAAVKLGLSPMLRLAQRMQLVALMHLEAPPESDPPLVFFEMLETKKAFDCMVQRLSEYREFLPQSMLATEQCHSPTAQDATEHGYLQSSLGSDVENESDCFSVPVTPVATTGAASVPPSAQPGTPYHHHIRSLPSQNLQLQLLTMARQNSQAMLEDASNGTTTIASVSTAAGEGSRTSASPQGVCEAGSIGGGLKQDSSAVSVVESLSSEGHTSGGARGSITNPLNTPGWEHPMSGILSPPVSPPQSPRFAIRLIAKKVSLVAVMQRGFEEICVREPEEALRRHGWHVEVAMVAAKRHKGMVEGFAGDLITVTFNVHRVVTSHRAYALAFAADIRSQNSATGDLAIGVSSGRVMAGNMGCPGLKQFNLLGDAANACPKYAYLAAHWGLRIIASTHLLRDSGYKYEWRCLYDVVFASGRKRTVCEVLHELTASNDEWMYTLEKMNDSPYRLMDRAVSAIFAGQYRQAVEHIARAQLQLGSSSPGSNFAQHRHGLEQWALSLIASNAPPPEPLFIHVPVVHDPNAVVHLSSASRRRAAASQATTPHVPVRSPSMLSTGSTPIGGDKAAAMCHEVARVLRSASAEDSN